ncbi:type VII secretion protein EccB [Streptomyces sp. NPDC058548]|uniref:type VII secretion protein EccB n=1 Tax=unclassified Streptomyces TaxID=2593676 RepID=UPI0036473CDD
MQSRRDQVQAHLFVMSRLSAGLLRAEPDAPDIPTARTTRGVRTGLVIGLLIALIMAVYGLISPGGTTGWQKPGTLIVVKDTGARFLYLGGELRPVLNQTSAKLLLGEKMTVTQVSGTSLAGVPRGGPVGLLGAPDALPAAKAMTDDAWLACAVREPAATGDDVVGLRLAIGTGQGGRTLAAGQAVLISTPDRTPYLLWGGRRMRLDAANGAVGALGYAGATPVSVPASFLNTLPAGPDLAPPDILRRGAPGPALAGLPTRIGQLFTGPAGERYVLGQGGLELIDTLRFDLLRGDPRTQRVAYGGAAVTAAPIGPADLTAHPGAARKDTGLPATPPALVTVPSVQGVCAGLRPGPDGPLTTISLVDREQLAGRAPTVEPGIRQSCAEADRIAVLPGGGALVRALSGGGNGTTAYLVADNGVKYPLATEDVAQKLGYGTVPPVGVPGVLLTLLPTGPSLDPSVLEQGGVIDETTPQVPCPKRTGS